MAALTASDLTLLMVLVRRARGDDEGAEDLEAKFGKIENVQAEYWDGLEKRINESGMYTRVLELMA